MPCSRFLGKIIPHQEKDSPVRFLEIYSVIAMRYFYVGRLSTLLKSIGRDSPGPSSAGTVSLPNTVGRSLYAKRMISTPLDVAFITPTLLVN